MDQDVDDAVRIDRIRALEDLKAAVAAAQAREIAAFGRIAAQLANGTPADRANGDGHCAACNYAKQGPGWSIVPRPVTYGQHEYTITTPTGYTYSSRPPAPPGRSTATDLVVRKLATWLRSA